MPVESGQMLLHYHLVEKIGEGGMGVVWKAVDTTLDRDVAIKVLPATFAGDPERLARFQREAKLLASLNHPNLASVFGVHDSEGTRFLAMELIPGEDLAARLTRGPLPVDEAIDFARQTAEALEAAHERGVIHRDLKPANIRVTTGGLVKVLDLGLAKALAPETAPDTDASVAPTQTSAGSVPGVILGTVAYMSPEQARGQVADRRSDIWSFGCVLWECLTGRPLFGRETPSDSIGAILHTEPDWTQLPSGTPSAVHRVLRRCLVKDPRKRLHHVADARIELAARDEAALTEPGLPSPTVQRSLKGYRRAVGVLTLALVAAVIAVIATLSRQGADPSKAHLDNPLAGATFTRLTAFEGAEFDADISPDGRFVAFVSDRDGPFDVLVGQIGAGEFRNLTQDRNAFGAEDARAPVRGVGFNRDGSEIWLVGGSSRRMKFVPLLTGPMRNALGEDVVNADWSPDGNRVVYHKRAPGDPVFVADHNGANSREILGSGPGNHQHFPTWSLDGRWIFLVRGRPSTGEMDLWRMRPDGEELEQLTEHKWDVAYPAPIDARTVLYVAREPDGAGPWVWALDLETGSSRRVSFGLEQYTSMAASADGRRVVATIAYTQASLFSVPILNEPATENDVQPFPGLQAARALAPRFGGPYLFYLSSRGTGDGLWRYRDGEAVEIWKGTEIALLEPAAISPDGNSVALILRQDGRLRLHILSADGAELRSLAETVDVRGAASWSPDGEWLVAGGSKAGVPGLFKIPLDGNPPLRISDGEVLNPVWSPDGRLIVYTGRQVEAVAPLTAVRPDGTPVKMPDIALLRRGERMRFMPDGSGLVYMLGSLQFQDFWLLDLATMESRQLTRLDDTAAMRSFDISPDGTTIVFDRLREKSDIVLIDLETGPPGE
jgi:Tol biopolymer transport system component